MKPSTWAKWVENISLVALVLHVTFVLDLDMRDWRSWALLLLIPIYVSAHEAQEHLALEEQHGIKGGWTS